MNLLNNLTFAIITTEDGWRNDLTIRFCEYFSRQINGDNFHKNLIFVESVDQALGECETDYLLIQTSGHIPFLPSFFNVLEQCIVENSDIFIGKLKIADDYVVLEKNCLFVNKLLWLENDSPSFKSKIHEGPAIRVTSASADKYRPSQIAIDAEAEQKTTYVSGECSLEGAALIVKQLEVFGTATGFSGACSEEDYFYLDYSNPFTELKTETYFEKVFLKKHLQFVNTYETPDETELKDTRAEVVIAQARGMKPYLLAKTFEPSHVIVYDNNEASLELQRRIFGNTVPRLLSEIVTQFKQENPSIILTPEWEEHKDAGITPLLGVKVEFKLVDSFSYEMEDLVRSVCHTKTLVIDLAESFVYPYNFYRRPFYQVQGLFGEIYSILKSRTGPTHILGMAPGYQQLDHIDVNTSNKQYEPKIELAEDEEPVIDPTEYVAPELASRYEDKNTAPPISTNPTVSAKPTFKSIAVEQKEYDVMPFIVKELLVDRTPAKMEGPTVNIPTDKPAPVEAPIVAPPVLIVPEPVVIPEPAIEVKPNIELDPVAIQGYVRSIDGEFQVLIKRQVFDEFTAILEYRINNNAAWSFFVSAEGGSKKIEFSNGLTEESFNMHLNLAVKINPKTVVKYLK